MNDLGAMSVVHGGDDLTDGREAGRFAAADLPVLQGLSVEQLGDEEGVLLEDAEIEQFEAVRVVELLERAHLDFEPPTRPALLDLQQLHRHDTVGPHRPPDFSKGASADSRLEQVSLRDRISAFHMDVRSWASIRLLDRAARR